MDTDLAYYYTYLFGAVKKALEDGCSLAGFLIK